MTLLQEVRTRPARVERRRFWRFWRAIRPAIRDMNYASRRVAELNAPWTVDEQWHRGQR
jgi:hypothetical protein